MSLQCVVLVKYILDLKTYIYIINMKQPLIIFILIILFKGKIVDILV